MVCNLLSCASAGTYKSSALALRVVQKLLLLNSSSLTPPFAPKRLPHRPPTPAPFPTNPPLPLFEPSVVPSKPTQKQLPGASAPLLFSMPPKFPLVCPISTIKRIYPAPSTYKAILAANPDCILGIVSKSGAMEKTVTLTRLGLGFHTTTKKVRPPPFSCVSLLGLLWRRQ